jgi:hypothetical protein
MDDEAISPDTPSASGQPSAATATTANIEPTFAGLSTQNLDATQHGEVLSLVHSLSV